MNIKHLLHIGIYICHFTDWWVLWVTYELCKFLLRRWWINSSLKWYMSSCTMCADILGNEGLDFLMISWLHKSLVSNKFIRTELYTWVSWQSFCVWLLIWIYYNMHMAQITWSPIQCLWISGSLTKWLILGFQFFIVEMW